MWVSYVNCWLQCCTKKKSQYSVNVRVTIVTTTSRKSWVSPLSLWSQCSSSYGQSKNNPCKVNGKIMKNTSMNNSQLFKLATLTKIFTYKAKQIHLKAV